MPEPIRPTIPRLPAVARVSVRATAQATASAAPVSCRVGTICSPMTATTGSFIV